jgi:hypothetical protein
MFFNWYHKVIVKYKYFRKSLEAAGSGSNLRFNYSHLEKHKESLTEVETEVKLFGLNCWINCLVGAQPIFFSQIREKQVYNYFCN